MKELCLTLGLSFLRQLVLTKRGKCLCLACLCMVTHTCLAVHQVGIRKASTLVPPCPRASAVCGGARKKMCSEDLQAHVHCRCMRCAPDQGAYLQAALCTFWQGECVSTGAEPSCVVKLCLWSHEKSRPMPCARKRSARCTATTSASQ
jgi:hypothetical protein